MATRYGWEKATALRAKGWKIKKVEEITFSDPIMIDPVDGKEYTPYEGEAIQKKRDDEESVQNCLTTVIACLC